MAEARDCGSRHESSILSGHPSFFGSSIPSLPATAGSVSGRPERSERSSDCSIQSPAAILCLSSKGQGSRLRTDRSRFESSQAHQIFFPSLKGQGTSLRSSGSAFESPREGHGPVAEGDATDCLSVPMRVRIPSGSPVLVLWGYPPVAGAAAFNRRTPVRFRVSLPELSGPKHRRRCTRLLPAKAGFEFLRTHQYSGIAKRQGA